MYNKESNKYSILFTPLFSSKIKYIWFHKTTQKYYISSTPPNYFTPIPPINDICKNSKELSYNEVKNGKCEFEECLWEFSLN